MRKIKKIVLMMGIVLPCVCAVTIGRKEVSLNNHNDLLSENIEALTKEEVNPPIKKKDCYNTITSKKASQVLYCPPCDYVPGTYLWYTKLDQCPKDSK